MEPCSKLVMLFPYTPKVLAFPQSIVGVHLEDACKQAKGKGDMFSQKTHPYVCRGKEGIHNGSYEIENALYFTS